MTLSRIFQVMSEAGSMSVFAVSHTKNLCSRLMKTGYFEMMFCRVGRMAGVCNL